MPMIAKASGISPGAIYKHFDSKAELFFEVVRRTVHSIAAPVEAGSTSAPALLLPHVVAMYTEPALKRLRQLAVEMHYASEKHPKVLKLLRRSVELRIEQLRDGIAGAQRDGTLDSRPDPELLASVLMVFIMGLMHMETLLPQLVGDPKWHDFVQDRARRLLDVADAPSARSTSAQRKRSRELIDGMMASLDAR